MVQAEEFQELVKKLTENAHGVAYFGDVKKYLTAPLSYNDLMVKRWEALESYKKGDGYLQEIKVPSCQCYWLFAN